MQYLVEMKRKKLCSFIYRQDGKGEPVTLIVERGQEFTPQQKLLCAIFGESEEYDEVIQLVGTFPIVSSAPMMKAIIDGMLELQEGEEIIIRRVDG